MIIECDPRGVAKGCIVPADQPSVVCSTASCSKRTCLSQCQGKVDWLACQSRLYPLDAPSQLCSVTSEMIALLVSGQRRCRPRVSLRFVCR